MFHEGSLQTGIALAIKEHKLVACFVRDDGATSKQWEDEWLKSGWLSSLLEQKAVLLRIEAGSTEAGFLAPFCDLQDTPTLVVIHGGQLQVQLKSDATQTEFINAVRKVLGANPIPASSSAQPSTPQASTPEPTGHVTPAEAEDDLYWESEPVASTTPARTTTTTVPTLSANARGKQKATAASDNAATSSMTKAQQEARDALRKKKRQEAEDLARVKARIDADRAARKAQAEARKLERERERDAQGHHQTQAPVTTSTRGSQAKSVNLQVRLFDGRTIRSTFPRTANLQDDVRKWVDDEFGKLAADDPNINNKKLPPYFFRHILPPQPSRELSAGDESQTLGDIDLAPSATLVLVPVKGYTEAYAGGGGVIGTATGFVGGAFGLLSSTVGYVGSTLGSVIGYGSTPAQQGQPGQLRGSNSDSDQASQQPTNANANTNASTDTTGIRVRTLADQRAREPRDQQFYNGNQLDTLPNNDENDRRQ